MAGPKKFRPDWWVQDVGKRIAWVREEAGISQTKMAELLGCSQQTISDYEKGLKDPDPYLMGIFCARFKVTMEYIFRADVSGCDPALARALLLGHEELTNMQHDMDRYMGKVLASNTAHTA
jgi:transcriptional regulator with XRE-family HTH domain